ncbi:MAG: STAS domain-containing protein [Microcoleaceae cyanobacterium]
MKINSTTQADNIIVELIGDIDAKTSPVVQEEVLPLFHPDSKILLDFSQVEYMSSAGLRILLTLNRYASSKKSQMVLSGLSEEVKDVMSMTGFLKFFITCDTVTDGLKILEESPN